MIKLLINNLDKFLHRHSYTIFLITLIFWIGFLPLFELTGQLEKLEFLMISILIVSSFYFFYKAKKRFQYLIVSPITMAVVIFAEFTQNPTIIQIERLIIFLLFYLITSHFVVKIIKSKIVDLQIIIVSVSAYIMIGFMASILCWFTYNLYPGAYNIEINENGPIMDFMYYSIVTMSTLGYGDIIPLIPQSKSLTMVITLVGQFYMAILVAFLVGKFLNERSK